MKVNFKYIFSYFLLFCLLMFQLVFSAFAAGQGAPAFVFTSEDQEKGKLVYETVNKGDVIETSFDFELVEDVPATIGMNFNSYVDNEELPERLNLSSWAKFPEGFNLTLKGLGDRQRIPVEIHIPEDAYPGDYKGAFIASVTSYGDAVLGKKGDSKMGAVVKVGKGISFLMRVAGDLVEKLVFENMEYTLSEDGALVLDLDYKNDGNVLLKPTAVVTVSSLLGGDELFKQVFELNSIGPGKDVKAEVINLADNDLFLSYGIYDVDVKMNYKPLNLFDTGKDEVASLAGIASMTVYRLPIVFIIIMVVLLLFVVSYFVWRAIALSKLKAASKVYVVQQGDTLQIVSSKFQVDPSLIIKVNSLKSPYFLVPNQEILVPKS